VCPIDKTPLELSEWESSPTALSPNDVDRIRALSVDPNLFCKDIQTGLLVNRARKVFYPIERGIPRLLIYPTALTSEFRRRHAQRLDRELPGFDLPNEKPPPGEGDVLRSFSNEWTSYEWNPEAYWNLSYEDMCRSMRHLLDLDRKPIKGQLVLEVGIGIGGIADYVSRSETCELIGVDLGYAVDAAQKNFGGNPLLHIVQASVFALPFEDKTFDFVYSHGAIMHTYSTKTAFDRLATLPRIGGRLYVWVYSQYDEQRNTERRLLMTLEKLLRPVVWRLPESVQTMVLLPISCLYLVHQNLLVKRRQTNVIKYGWRESIHAARDRFTPRYAHRHTDDEVCGWFREANYVKLQCVSKREYPESIPLPFVTAAAVDGMRN
jgi:uncharacterized protein YbaR (Trm112 family)/cyclopropane fatty-acyl-phospholipid synthase-like methyltransferase